jgi:phosphoglycerol geranylgeranyltransferase
MVLIDELLKQHKCLHFSLIDPENQTARKAGIRAGLCQRYGTNAIMVGGSTVTEQQRVYDTVNEIKKNTDLPVILFPNSARAISKNADYIFFMELLNSKELRYRGEEQRKGVTIIKKWKIKPISMGYIVVSTSKNPTTIEQQTRLDRVGPTDAEKAVSYSLYAEMRGMSCVYLEAGSNAEKPVPNKMIEAVKESIEIPLIVGGGINDAGIAREKIDAGADVIVNGTATESNIRLIGEIIREIGDSCK